MEQVESRNPNDSISESELLTLKFSFMSSCIEHLRQRHIKLIERCDNAKRWMIPIWLGTIALLAKEKSLSGVAVEILFLELIAFYILESFFHYFVKKYRYNLCHLEAWLMSSTTEEILGHKKGAFELMPELPIKTKLKFAFFSMLNPAAIAFYSFILILSVAAYFMLIPVPVPVP